jgi:uncharacterized protein DUF4832/uncharacterized protein DUF4874
MDTASVWGEVARLANRDGGHVKRSWKLVVLSFIPLGIAIFASCQAGKDQTTATKTYTASGAQILNPERGWWYTIAPEYTTNNTQATLTTDQLLDLKQTQGVTVVRKYYVIDDWVNSDIPADVSDPNTVDLKMIRDDFAAARGAGMKLIQRFNYQHNFEDPTLNHQDASETQTLRHIDQLAPIWQANKDVLLHLQAGFIGCWGEWHTTGTCGTSTHVDSTGNLTQTGIDIAHHLMSSVPPERLVAFRSPYKISLVFGMSRLTSVEYYTGSERSRVGFHNDSVAYDTDDRGTYWGDHATWQPYMQAFTAVNVMDGEPSGETIPYTRDTFLSVLAANHQDLLNMNHSDPACDDLYAWLKSSGHFETIRKSLGYRFRLVSVSYPTQITAGGSLNVEVSMANDGWGKVFNPREVNLILRDTSTGEEYKMPLSGDGRHVLPLSGQTKTLNLGGTLPSTLPSGDYQLYLHLADPLLPTTPAYSIQLANDDVWETQTGYNSLGITTSINATP